MEGQIIPAGSVQKLLCVSSGGNPLATLTWYKNDKRVSAEISLLFLPSFVCIFRRKLTHTQRHTHTLNKERARGSTLSTAGSKHPQNNNGAFVDHFRFRFMGLKC